MAYFDMIPEVTLFHYTSLSGLLNIVDENFIRATHIAHLSDASELHYAGALLTKSVKIRAEMAEPSLKLFLEQLSDWIGIGWYLEQPLFTSSFSENGNLLSQWQAYCPSSGGVSLGFNPDQLLCAADTQAFQLTKCVYEIEGQLALIEAWLDEVIALRDEVDITSTKNHPTQSYHAYFGTHQASLLSILARMKHPAFAAEREWRLISQVNPNLLDPAVKFRATPTRLVPYVNFALPVTSQGNLSLDCAFTGPAMEHNLSFSSLASFLTNKRVFLPQGITASGIPLRNW